MALVGEIAQGSLELVGDTTKQLLEGVEPVRAGTALQAFTPISPIHALATLKYWNVDILFSSIGLRCEKGQVERENSTVGMEL